MNDKTFQEAFDHFTRLSSSEKLADPVDRLFLDTFRALVVERNQQLATFKKMEAVITRANQQEQEQLGTARAQFQTIGELTDVNMKMESEIEKLRAENVRLQAQVMGYVTAPPDEDDADIDVLHTQLTNAEEAIEELQAEIQSLKRDVSDLEDEKALISDKLTQAENRIMQFLSVGKR